MKPASVYVCVTSDIVQSRRVRDREVLQRNIAASLAEANARFSQAVVVPLSVTLGDEWQGLLSSLDGAYEIDLFLRGRLAPETFRTGVGIGELSTPLKARTADMDGACFHRSRAALERARGRKAPTVLLDSGDALLDEPANAIRALLSALAAGWTERQRLSVAAYRELGTEKAAAEKVGVSQPALHKSLAGARGKEFVEGFERLLAFVRAYPLAG